jgi:hypothetical protein
MVQPTKVAILGGLVAGKADFDKGSHPSPPALDRLRVTFISAAPHIQNKRKSLGGVDGFSQSIG